jgi:hypothetical protein
MFEVIVVNEILGNSSHIMSMKQIRNFNLCALACAVSAERDGKPHSIGMWTVRPLEPTMIKEQS